MKTDIHPNCHLALPGGDKPTPGFYLGKIFIPMNPHRGHVGLLPTHSGKGCGHRFVKGGNRKDALYDSCYFTLRIRGLSEPRTENEVYQVAASCGKRLVVTFDKGNKEGY